VKELHEAKKGNSQATFNLRANRHKFNVLTQGIRVEPIVLVSAVKADILS
jgi:hypothetical protein